MDLRRVKLLLIPTSDQKHLLYKSSYFSDRMYNIALQWNRDYYNESGLLYSRYDLIRMLPEFKKNNPDFLEVDGYVLKDAVTNLRTAFNRGRDNLAKFPKFKKLGRKLSFGVRSDRLKVYENSVKIPGIGVVKCKHCHWLTRHKSNKQLLSIQYHSPYVKFDGKYWFLSFCIEVDIAPDAVTDEVIGVDVGIINTVYTSDGVSKKNINNTRQIEILERRKKRLQRKTSRKYECNKIGRRYIKTRNIKRCERKLKIINRRIKNIRENYIHHLVNEIVNKYPKRIMLEDLKIKNMTKNTHLARAIQAQCFHRIRLLLIEKAVNTMSVQVGIIPWNYPSSKRCSRCGSIRKDLKLSDRVYHCPNCGVSLDRDYNAALNIRDCKKYVVVAN